MAPRRFGPSFQRPSIHRGCDGREDERVYAAVIDDGQFEVTVERRAGYRLAFHQLQLSTATGMATLI
jgi:hypothetical protein